MYSLQVSTLFSTKDSQMNPSVFICFGELPHLSAAQNSVLNVNLAIFSAHCPFFFRALNCVEKGKSKHFFHGNCFVDLGNQIQLFSVSHDVSLMYPFCGFNWSIHMLHMRHIPIYIPCSTWNEALTRVTIVSEYEGRRGCIL